MQLILLQKVKNLGNLGDKVNVKPGYGRNYLVPQGKAMPATESAIADFEKRRAEYEAKNDAVLGAAETRKASLEGATVTVKANASPEGKLFGSVTPADVAGAIRSAGGPTLDRRTIEVPGHIKTIGKHSVNVRLHPDVTVTFPLEVTPQ